MKITIPKTITNAMVTANTAVNADADYVPATVYALGNKVTYDNYIYLSLQNTNTGNQPDLTASAAWWSKVGVSNKWAMFDDEVQTQTTKATSLSFTVRADFITDVALLNMTGQTLEIEVKKDATVIYAKTIDLVDVGLIGDWSEYFFSDWSFNTEHVFRDIPKIPEIDIKITISASAGNVGIGVVKIGDKLDAGLDEYGIKREVIDYTLATFDKFGALTLDKQARAKKFSGRAIIENTYFDFIAKKLDSISGVPVVVDSSAGRYNTLIAYGLLSYSMDLAHFPISYISFDLKGLT